VEKSQLQDVLDQIMNKVDLRTILLLVAVACGLLWWAMRETKDETSDFPDSPDEAGLTDDPDEPEIEVKPDEEKVQ
jgi:nitrogen fixation-related uncharacterized protein